MVAADIKYLKINESPRSYIYLPFLQLYRPNMVLHSRGHASADVLVDEARARIAALGTAPMVDVGVGLAATAVPSAAGTLHYDPTAQVARLAFHEHLHHRPRLCHELREFTSTMPGPCRRATTSSSRAVSAGSASGPSVTTRRGPSCTARSPRSSSTTRPPR
jgi:hypothetical protein